MATPLDRFVGGATDFLQDAIIGEMEEVGPQSVDVDHIADFEGKSAKEAEFRWIPAVEKRSVVSWQSSRSCFGRLGLSSQKG